MVVENNLPQKAARNDIASCFHSAAKCNLIEFFWRGVFPAPPIGGLLANSFIVLFLNKRLSDFGNMSSFGNDRQSIIFIS